MKRTIGRRAFLGAALSTTLAGCGGSLRTTGSSTSDSGQAGLISDAQINAAVAQLDSLVNTQRNSTGIPGVSVAVVQANKTLYAKGYGTRLVGSGQNVDADTVFLLASVSKSLGSTVVAHQVGQGGIAWDTPVCAHLPWFTLSDPEVSAELSIGDLYAHRSGLPDHAGDLLEDLGYGQTDVLQRLRYLLLGPFRRSYAYTNFGITAAAESVAAASGTDWATLSEQALYTPLGMTSTSSRHVDFVARSNRALQHVRVNNQWVQSTGTNADAQSPAGGVSSSANDMAKWLSMMLGAGVFGGTRVIDATALASATSAQSQIAPAGNGSPASFYGFGFNVGESSAGRPFYSHSGAFSLGSATTFMVVPSTGIGIVVLTNAYPIGVAETIANQFFDLVQYGTIQRDWASLFSNAFAPLAKPTGSLVGAPRPAAPLPARAMSTYTGTYRNDYYGPIQVIEQGGGLAIVIGPDPTTLALAHWDGDVFTFMMLSENANPGTISKATFTSDSVTLEYYDAEKLGTFVR
jgi:CubicO group peptidase (beta-lactamase class C family)